MESTLWWFALAASVAVMCLLEATWTLWSSRHGPQARRLAQRLRAVSSIAGGSRALARAGSAGEVARPWLVLDRRLEAWADRRGLRWLSVRRMRAWIAASGSSLGVLEGVAVSLVLSAVLAAAVFAWRPGSWAASGAALVGAIAPWLVLVQRRARRQERLERQFPQALDLIGRALRAGHSLSAAIRMAAEELPDPLVQEFRSLFEALNYGEPLPEALTRFAQRVPLSDAGYFAVAVIVQRDTGGNLAEVLDQIASLVRDRLRLRGEVRTLSAEGRLSAVILTALPFGVAAVVQIVNPGFLSPLWTDPAGQQMVTMAALGILVGVVWMRTIIRIRV